MSELPAGWTTARLGDLGEWVGGGTPSKRVPSFWRGEIPWVSPKDMKVPRIRDTEDHITPEAVEKSTTTIVPPGSVLVVTRSGILRHSLPVAVADRAVALNQDLKGLIPTDGLVPDYVAWALRAFAHRILHTCARSGTTVQNIETARLLSFEIPTAPTAEQQRIVAAIGEHLSRLDAAENSLRLASRRLRVLRGVVFRSAPDGDYPTVPLSDVVDIVSGQTPKGVVPLADGPVPFFKVGDMNAAIGYDMANARAYVDAELIEIFKFKVRPAGTVIFPKRGGAIATNKKRILREPAVFDLNTMGLIPSERLMPRFLLYWLETKELGSLADGSNVPQINLPDIAPLQIPVPSVDEQGRIVEQIEAQLSVLEAANATTERAKRRSVALRRSILEQAFTGALVPQDPSDEPTSILLGRIASERGARSTPSSQKRTIPA